MFFHSYICMWLLRRRNEISSRVMPKCHFTTYSIQLPVFYSSSITLIERNQFPCKSLVCDSPTPYPDLSPPLPHPKRPTAAAGVSAPLAIILNLTDLCIHDDYTRKRRHRTECCSSLQTGGVIFNFRPL